MKIKIGWLFVTVLMLTSCGGIRSVRTAKTTAKADGASLMKETLLSAEQQRKYDYFFLEAMRMKGKNEYDAAFGLLQHCLDINPTASSALYEISQYYMFLRQVPQGQVALEQAVAFAPDNYWYSQGLVSLYQQQNELDKAAALLEKMVTRFPSKQDPLFSLLDIYSRQEKYNDVISTLNRLEKRLGKNEQLSMEKFRIYLQMKDDKKAFQEIESLVQEYPMDMRYQVILGDVYLQNGKKQEAYDAYQKVLAVEPDNPMALFSMASYYEQTGQKELYQQQLDTLLPLYKKWGLKGIKFGFVQIGNQRWSTWLHDAVRKCGEYNLMVDIHDEYRPTGFSRTYPNLMTQEGIRGNEEMPDATHNTTLPFTRYLAGAGDYTLCYFNNRVKNTKAHQLAMAAVYYSPLQFMFWYDRPEFYQGEEELEFWKAIPSVWDDSRALDGEIGEYIVQARRSGNDWFVGAMTNTEARTITLTTDFLEPGKKYMLHLYEDDDKLKTRTKVRSTHKKIKAGDKLVLKLKASGGAALHFTPLKK